MEWINVLQAFAICLAGTSLFMLVCGDRKLMRAERIKVIRNVLIYSAALTIIAVFMELAT